MKFNLLKPLFFVILIIFPFGQLLRFDLTNFIPGLKIQAIDFAVFLFTFAGLIKVLFKKEKLNIPVFSFGLLAFCIIASFSLLIKINQLNLSEFLSSLFYLLRLFNLTIFFLLLIGLFHKSFQMIFLDLLCIGTIIAFFSLIQYLFIPDTRFLLNFGWDEHYYRAIGTFIDPAFTGLLLSLAFIIWINGYQIFNGRKIFYWLMGIILLFATALSFSRISFISLIVSLGISYLMKKQKKKFLIIILIFIIVVTILPKPGGEGVNLWRISSFIARSDSFQKTVKIAKNNFWLGVGFNAFRFTQRDYGFISLDDWQNTNAGAGTDNSFLFVLATTGIFGLIFFVYFWIKAFWLSFKKKDSISGRVLFSSLILIILSSMVVNSLFYPWILIWLFILMAKFTVDNSKSIPFLFCSRPDQD